MSRHHVPPKSRGGRKTVTVPDAFHRAWHVVFEDLFGAEAEGFIAELNFLFRIKDKVTAKDLTLLRDRMREK